jgi:hypothetical protein
MKGMSHLATRLSIVAAVVAIWVAGASAARADTLNDQSKRLIELRKRIDLWVNLEQQDPDKDTIARYQAQQEDDFKKKDRVKASDLVAIIVKKDKEDAAVRIKAAEVLGDASMKTFDPDLQPPKSRGKASKRSEFAREHLLPWLTKSDKKDGSRLTRNLVHQILTKWFNVGGNNQLAINLYDADNEATWQRAYNAWREVIKDG